MCRFAIAFGVPYIYRGTKVIATGKQPYIMVF